MITSRCYFLYYYPPTSCFLRKISFKSALLCHLPEAQAWGDSTPRFRSASPGVTHGATSTRLGWPSGHSGQAGGDLNPHSIRAVRKDSQRTSWPDRTSVDNLIRQERQQPYKKSVLLSANFLFFVKDFLQISTFVSPPRGSGLGRLHPQVPLRFTWGYSWRHLYEVGVALRSFGPSGRRLEVFLHAIRLFRLNSQKKR
jgi:hypothetical protein